MTFLLIPTSTYSSAWDRMTRAHFRKDKENLQLMLEHLSSFPSEWSITRDGASFPQKGAKQVLLNYDHGKLEYTFNSSDKFRPLEGHYAKQFNEIITKHINEREKETLLRNFYPELNGQLMLGKS